MVEKKPRNEKSRDSKSKHTSGVHYSNFDFEGVITKSLEAAKIPVSKLFIDAVKNKPFLKKMTVRTTEGKHFRMVVGKQELEKGHIMFQAILKAKYLQALKMPEKPKLKTNGQQKRSKTHKPKLHGGTKGGQHKPSNKGRVGTATKGKDGNHQKQKSTLE